MRYFWGKAKKGELFLAFTMILAISASIYAPVFADDMTKVVEDHVLYSALKDSWSLSCVVFDDSSYSITVSDSCRENVKSLSLYGDKENSDGVIHDISILPELFPNITSLTIERFGLTDLDGISGFNYLNNLNLYGNDLSDISDLSGLTTLTSLSLYSNSISDISGLSGLTTLTYLSLSYNNISEIGDLSGLTNLTNLDLSNNNISEIDALSGLTNLNYLYLSNNNISEIDALSGLANLTELDLSNNNISEIDNLFGLANLTRLDLSNNNISEIGDLSGITRLEELDLSYNNISDISDFSGLTSLEELNLSHNSISDIAPLNTFTGLRYVELSHNSITKIPDLSAVQRLEEINLNYNEISDISNLASATSIRELLLGGNKISDISALGGLTNLNKLRLSDNRISDISDLVGLRTMRHLYIDGNPDITDYSALGGIKWLRTIDLSYNGLDDEKIGLIAGYISDANRQGDDDMQLEILMLNGNPNISDWSFLAGFEELECLYIKSNNIGALPDLSANEELYMVDLSDNNISDISDIVDKLPAYIEDVWLQNNKIVDASPALELEDIDYITFAGNSISEAIQLNSDMDDDDQDIAIISPFMNQKIDLVFSGNTGDMPRILKQIDDFINDSIENGDISTEGKEILTGSRHYDNIILSEDLASATIIDKTKPATIDYYVDYDDLASLLLEDGGKGESGIDDDYDQDDDEIYWYLRYSFGYDYGQGDKVHFLRINIMSDEMNNPKTVDNIMIAVMCILAAATVTIFSVRKYMKIIRK